MSERSEDHPTRFHHLSVSERFATPNHARVIRPFTEGYDQKSLFQAMARLRDNDDWYHLSKNGRWEHAGLLAEHFAREQAQHGASTPDIGHAADGVDNDDHDANEDETKASEFEVDEDEETKIRMTKMRTTPDIQKMTPKKNPPTRSNKEYRRR